MLERGIFELPRFEQGDSGQISWRDLVLILEGVVLNSIKKKRRFLLQKKKNRVITFVFRIFER